MCTNYSRNEPFAALPSLGRGGHIRSFSPIFGAKALSQPYWPFAALALKPGSLSLTTPPCRKGAHVRRPR
eukprot:6956629-Prymnesium_polylepis.1